MRNPHFVSRNAHVDPNGGFTLEGMLRETGGNTGNLLFISAVQRVVKYDRLSNGISFDARKVRSECDGIVIPAANWLKESTVAEGESRDVLSRRIAKAKLPCVMIGLGAQASLDEKIPSLQPGMLRLLSVVAERSKSISVRGEFSGRVLEAHGFKNFTVTGCPSLLWHVTRTARVQKRKKRICRLSFSGTRGEFDDIAFNPVYAPGLLLARLAKRLSADYVAQTELPDMYFGTGRFDAEGVYDRALAFVKRIYDDPDEVALHGYLAAHLRCFFDVEEWIAYMATRDFAIGTRLHGVIASLLAGTPALLVAHDARTKEMADRMSIPSVEAARVTDDKLPSMQRLYDETDFDAFNTAQVDYFKGFAAFLEENRVRHRLPKAIANHAKRAATPA